MQRGAGGRVSYYRFGYVPSGRWMRDVLHRNFGFPALIKRLQARDIMRSMNLQDSSRVLDVGCGSGFMTVEMAKSAQLAVGVDIPGSAIPLDATARRPANLRFELLSDTELPFPDQTFDRVLCSEVLPVLPDPRLMIEEVHRVLADDGFVIFVNGIRPQAIESAYAHDSHTLRALRLLGLSRTPRSFSEYLSRLQSFFETETQLFESENWISLVEETGFEVVDASTTPDDRRSAWCAWINFLAYVITGRPTIGRTTWIVFPFLEVAVRPRGNNHGLSLVLVCRKSLPSGTDPLKVTR